MGKLVVLKLDGEVATGFRVTLEISPEGGRRQLEMVGRLPPAEELFACYRSWRSRYYDLGFSHRAIVPKEIVYNGSPFRDLEACRQQAQQLCDCLNDWLRSPSFLTLREKWLEHIRTNEEVRILILTANLHLQQLPWHRWDFLERYPNTEIAISAPEYELPKLQASTIASTGRSRHRSRHPRQAKILAIFGNSRGIDLTQDRKLLQRLPKGCVRFLEEPSRQELNECLWQPWDILFFAGHSHTENGKGRVYINPSDSLTLDELKAALQKAVDNGLQLAIFNSCDGLGLAHQLEQLHIPQTIVMREPVPDRVAQEFLKYFLQSFAEGQPLYQAVREARLKLQALEDRSPCASWLPAIYQNPAVTPPTWSQLSGLGDEVRELLETKGLRQFQAIASIALAALTGIAAAYFYVGPKFAPLANSLGKASYQRQQFSRAEWYFHLASWLDPHFGKPHYNLGWICNQIRNDIPCARAKYQSAVAMGEPAAYAELARIYIMYDRDLPAALKVVEEGLKLNAIPWMRSALMHRRGWIRYLQDRYEEAEADLRQAIALSESSPHSYCLLSKILIDRGNYLEAMTAWQNAERYAQPRFPEQDECLYQAWEKLKGSANSSEYWVSGHR